MPRLEIFITEPLRKRYGTLSENIRLLTGILPRKITSWVQLRLTGAKNVTGALHREHKDTIMQKGIHGLTAVDVAHSEFYSLYACLPSQFSWTECKKKPQKWNRIRIVFSLPSRSGPLRPQYRLRN